MSETNAPVIADSIEERMRHKWHHIAALMMFERGIFEYEIDPRIYAQLQEIGMSVVADFSDNHLKIRLVISG